MSAPPTSAREPHDQDGDATLHEADKRILEKARKPCAHGRALCALVQFHPGSQNVENEPSDGGRDRNSAMVDEGRGSAYRVARGYALGSPACRLGLSAILGREVHFDIRWQPMQCPRHDGGNRRLIGTGGAAPKTRYMGLEIFALHNIV